MKKLESIEISLIASDIENINKDYQIAKENVEKLGISKNFTIIDTEDVNNVINRNQISTLNITHFVHEVEINFVFSSSNHANVTRVC